MPKTDRLRVLRQQRYGFETSKPDKAQTWFGIYGSLSDESVGCTIQVGDDFTVASTTDIAHITVK